MEREQKKKKQTVVNEFRRDVAAEAELQVRKLWLALLIPRPSKQRTFPRPDACECSGQSGFASVEDLFGDVPAFAPSEPAVFPVLLCCQMGHSCE